MEISKRFPAIQRGNGVMNDNLATLGDILLAVHDKTDQLDKAVRSTNTKVQGLGDTIQSIDAKNTPRENWSLWLLVATTVLSAGGIIIAILSYIKH